MQAYTTSDLEILSQARFNISLALLSCSKDSIGRYQKKSRIVRSKLSKGNVTKDLIMEIKKHEDEIEMFARYLAAYADISFYEFALEKPEKLEALRAVREAKANK